MSRICPGLFVAVVFASPAAAQPPAQPADRSLAAVPTDTFLFASVRVSKLWDHPSAKPIRDWYAAQKLGPLSALAGLEPGDVDRVTVFKASWNPEAGRPP